MLAAVGVQRGLQQCLGRADGGSRKHWFLASFALHRWLDNPPHGHDRRRQAEVVYLAER